MSDIVKGTSDNSKSNPFINWKSHDTKLLVTTVAATVIANVITVIVVALAILVARSTHLRPGATTGDWAFFWGEAFFPVMTIYLVVIFFRQSKGRSGEALGEFGFRIIKWTIIVIGVFAVFMTMIFALSLVGLATGIK